MEIITQIPHATLRFEHSVDTPEYPDGDIVVKFHIDGSKLVKFEVVPRNENVELSNIMHHYNLRVTIPEGVTEIAEKVFFFRNIIVSSESVLTRIGREAFAYGYADSLDGLKMTDRTELEDKCFYGLMNSDRTPLIKMAQYFTDKQMRYSSILVQVYPTDAASVGRDDATFHDLEPWIMSCIPLFQSVHVLSDAQVETVLDVVTRSVAEMGMETTVHKYNHADGGYVICPYNDNDTHRKAFVNIKPRWKNADPNPTDKQGKLCKKFADLYYSREITYKDVQQFYVVEVN